MARNETLPSLMMGENTERLSNNTLADVVLKPSHSLQCQRQYRYLNNSFSFKHSRLGEERNYTPDSFPTPI
jgi:hypothetical protein